MEGKKKSRKVKRTVLIVLCVILALILTLMIAVIAYMESMLGRINRVDKDDSHSPLSQSEYEEIINSQTETAHQGFTGAVIDPEDVDWGAHEVIDESSQVINILLIGQDRRDGEDRARSDAMILCTINKSAKTLTMTSLLRDMYVQIPGYQDNRINVSYALGGMSLLNKCIEKNFGVTIDGNVEVDFSSFRKVIDLVGGVDINLTSAEAKYLNTHKWENDIGSNFVQGMNHMNGEQALSYSRIRALDSDFGRTQRQRTVMNALVGKAKGMSLGELNAMLKELLPLLTTDMTNAEILGYAADILPMIGNLTVTTQRIPADGAYKDAWIRGMMVLLPDLQKNREILKNSMKH